MKTLDEIGVKNGTDKSSLNHHYLSFYELLFRDFVNPRILEIGVQFGNSLRTWKEYWPNSEIVGIDSVDNGVLFYPPHWVELHIGDAYCDEVLKSVIGHSPFDIMIDDASHRIVDQAWFVRNYSDLLSKRGILIVEDVLDKGTAAHLAEFLSSEFQSTTVEMTDGNSIVDSRLFIAWRK